MHFIAHRPRVCRALMVKAMEVTQVKCKAYAGTCKLRNGKKKRNEKKRKEKKRKENKEKSNEKKRKKKRNAN